ncbi:MAG: VanW family protein [Clostridiales bacterium]|nr:VanW family protein [Clostridiales bacterium]
MTNIFKYKNKILLAAFIIISASIFFVVSNKTNNYLAIHANKKNNDKVLISQFITKFNKYNLNRKENIRLATKAIDELIIEPGETFSFNNIVGKTSKDRGYKISDIIIKGKKHKSYGGGICQVSSTLYNSVLRANMEIVERHSHSKLVNYVIKNRDAAVSRGSFDFRFKNNKDYAIKINSYIYENRLVIEIFKI